MEIIKLDHITKQYDDGFVALKDINLELESGKFYSLLGPSGSGKTTILRIIAGFTEASAGKVYFDGQDITNLDASKRHINTVFQYGSFFINTAAVARSVLAYLLQNIVDVVRQFVIPGVAG